MKSKLLFCICLLFPFVIYSQKSVHSFSDNDLRKCGNRLYRNLIDCEKFMYYTDSLCKQRITIDSFPSHLSSKYSIVRDAHLFQWKSINCVRIIDEVTFELSYYDARESQCYVIAYVNIDKRGQYEKFSVGWFLTFVTNYCKRFNQVRLNLGHQEFYTEFKKVIFNKLSQHKTKYGYNDLRTFINCTTHAIDSLLKLDLVDSVDIKLIYSFNLKLKGQKIELDLDEVGTSNYYPCSNCHYSISEPRVNTLMRIESAKSDAFNYVDFLIFLIRIHTVEILEVDGICLE